MNTRLPLLYVCVPFVKLALGRPCLLRGLIRCVVWGQLKQRNMGVVKQLVEEISDPTHPSYGHYLSRDAVTALVAPSFQDVDAVATSLRMHGARDIGASRRLLGAS